MDCQPVVQLRCTTAVETAPCTSVAFGSKKCIFRFRSSNFILNTPVTCLLNPCDTIWRYIIHTNGLYTSFAVLQETPYFFTWTPRCVQVAMPRARRAAGSWAVQASLMSRHPGHVSISMRKGPAICMLNQWMTMLDRNILNLEWCCSILSGPKNRTVPVCGHAFDIQPCGPSSTCSSTEGLGLKLYWSCVPSSLLKNNVIPLISSNSP